MQGPSGAGAAADGPPLPVPGPPFAARPPTASPPAPPPQLCSRARLRATRCPSAVMPPAPARVACPGSSPRPAPVAPLPAEPQDPSHAAALLALFFFAAAAAASWAAAPGASTARASAAAVPGSELAVGAALDGLGGLPAESEEEGSCQPRGAHCWP